MSDLYARLPVAIAAVAPRVSGALWMLLLDPAMRRIGIATEREAAEFLGQCAEESGGFTTLIENLNYTAAELCRVFRRQFPFVGSTTGYVGNPERIANRVYAGRLGNGDEASGDGWRNRGGGLIQITGAALYGAFAAWIGQPDDDALRDWVRTPPGAAMSAAWYWSIRSANGDSLVHVSDRDDIVAATIAITRAVNGAETNIQTRESLVAAAMAALTDAAAAPSVAA